MTKSIFLILLLSLGGCGKKNDHKGSGIEAYADFVKSDFRNLTPEKIKSIFGDPNTVKYAKGSEVWDYGPSLEEMVKCEDGAIIGLTIYFDEHGKVRDVTPSRKTKR